MAKKRIIVQDQSREMKMIKVLGLIDNESRLGPDAEDDLGHLFELKSSTKNVFGTGRDVSISMIAEWRKRYWIFANGKNLEDGYVIETMWFCSPSMMKDRFDEIEKKFMPDLEIKNIVIKRMNKLLDKARLDRLEYLIERGMTYNNPHISMKYIKEHGIEVDLGDPKSVLKRLMLEHTDEDS